MTTSCLECLLLCGFGLASATVAVAIWRHLNPVAAWEGFISDGVVWGRALSKEQVKQLYAEAK